jgi:hypothetical protein
MANTYVDYTGADGTGTDGKDFLFSFEYLRDDHVVVTVDGVFVTNYSIIVSPTKLIRFDTTPAANAAIKIFRDSRGRDTSGNIIFDQLVDFENGSVLTENELDTSYKHNLFIGQEAAEGSGGEQLTKKGLTHYDAEGNKIINLGTPGASTDAANKGYVDQTIDNAIALGGSPAIVSLGGYDVTDITGSLTQSLANWTAPTATGSSEPRSLTDRFADVVNVLDYGAVGNGSTDDAAAIQNAINSGKKVIFDPSKTYFVGTTLNITSSDTVVDGMGATLTCSSTRITTLFNMDGVDNITIKNINWSPTAFGSGSSQARLVYFKDVQGLTVDSCKVINGALATSGEGSVNAKSSSIKFTRCKAYGDPTEGQNGMQIGAVTGLLVDQCEFYDYLFDAIKFTAPVNETTASSVTLDTTLGSAEVVVNQTGHDLEVSDKVDITSVTVGGITVAGVYRITEIVDANSYKIITREEATSTATSSSTSLTYRYPVTQQLAIYNSYFKNISPARGDSGIDIYGNGRNTIVEGNTFEGCANGVMFKNEETSGVPDGDVYNSVINANRFINCENPILLKYASFSRVSNNLFEYNGLDQSTGSKNNYDIFVRGPIKDVVIDKNTFSNSGFSSIRFDLAPALTGVDDVIEAKIVENTFNNINGDQGIISFGTTRTGNTKVDIIYNTFNDCVADTITNLVGGGNSVFRVTDNNIKDCTVSSAAIKIQQCERTDTFSLRDNFFDNLSGTEFQYADADARIHSNIASSGITGDTAIANRYTFTAASIDSQHGSDTQTILSGTRVKSVNSKVITTGFASSGSASTANRTIEMYASTGNMSIAGTLTQSVGFTDFAEMLPNGTNAEIPAGTILTLSNGAVVPANSGDDIHGVVSHTAAVLAGDTPFCWQGRYLIDEFGRRIMEDTVDEVTGEVVNAPKQNPLWNPELQQTPRSERPDEWTPVGLIGQVYVRVDASVVQGSKVKANNGIGTVSDSKTGLKCINITKAFDGSYGIAKCLININV